MSGVTVTARDRYVEAVKAHKAALDEEKRLRELCRVAANAEHEAAQRVQQAREDAWDEFTKYVEETAE